jgi:hypothetical protein
MTERLDTSVHRSPEDRRQCHDRRQVSSGDLHQRIEQKAASIRAENRYADRRHADVIVGRGEGLMPNDESPGTANWQPEMVSARLRVLSHYGIT